MEQKKAGRKWTLDEKIDVFVAVLDGATLAATGRKYGVSGTRIIQIMRQVGRKILYPKRQRANDIHWHSWSSLGNVRDHAEVWKREAELLRAANKKSGMGEKLRGGRV